MRSGERVRHGLHLGRAVVDGEHGLSAGGRLGAPTSAWIVVGGVVGEPRDGCELLPGRKRRHADLAVGLLA